MDDIEFKKNLLDLEHEKILNKQNMLIIVLSGAAISIILDKDIQNRFQIAIGIILIVILVFVNYNDKLNEIKSKIEKLNT